MSAGDNLMCAARDTLMRDKAHIQLFPAHIKLSQMMVQINKTKDEQNNKNIRRLHQNI